MFEIHSEAVNVVLSITKTTLGWTDLRPGWGYHIARSPAATETKRYYSVLELTCEACTMWISAKSWRHFTLHCNIGKSFPTQDFFPAQDLIFVFRNFCNNLVFFFIISPAYLVGMWGELKAKTEATKTSIETSYTNSSVTQSLQVYRFWHLLCTIYYVRFTTRFTM